LFQKKKADPGSIDFGFSKFPSTKSENGAAQGEGGGSPPPTGSSFASGYVFGARLAERTEKVAILTGHGALQHSALLISSFYRKRLVKEMVRVVR